MKQYHLYFHNYFFAFHLPCGFWTARITGRIILRMAYSCLFLINFRSSLVVFITSVQNNSTIVRFSETPGAHRNTGVGAGKFFGVQRIFAQISPNLPEKNSRVNDLQKKRLHFISGWALFLK